MLKTVFIKSKNNSLQYIEICKEKLKKNYDGPHYCSTLKNYYYSKLKIHGK